VRSNPDTGELRCRRADFDLPDDLVYLNSAYMGPLPRAVRQAGESALACRAQPWQLGAADFFEPAERVRAQCASLVNGEAESIALVPTAAWGLGCVAAQIQARAGQNIVVLGEQFPSNIYAWQPLLEQGARFRVVPAPQGERRAARWNAALLEAIDTDTVLVAVEQAHWTDGTLFDLAAVGRRAREVGAWFVIDATQTVGVMPLDVQSIQPDALVAHCYKSMLCNYGLGFAWYGPRMSHGRPVEQSWLLRQGAQDFARLVDYQDAYAPGMRRFDSSTRANPVLISMLDAALNYMSDCGETRIRAYLRSISRAFVEGVRTLGWRVSDESDRAANLFGLHAPQGTDLERVRTLLAQRRIHVSVRGSAIRVSPHVYNTPDDFARLLDALGHL
jgi:selenocysteine lyase/cysteine desulfurase